MIHITENAVELDVEGRYTNHGQIRLLGKARRRADGKWECLADVRGNLCLIEVSVTFGVDEPKD